MLELLRIAIALIGSAAGGWWDLKTTDVPDRLVFGMIAAGLALNAAEWFVFGNQDLFIASALTTVVFGLFALAMYKAGAWGGGDGAMLTAVGSLLPVWPFASVLSFLPFPAVYFFAVLLIGVPYSAAFSFAAIWRSPLKGRFVSSLRRQALPMVAAGLLALLALTMQPDLLGGLLALLLVVSIPVWQLSVFAERAFYRKISTRQLKPGDMLGEDLPRLKLFKRELRGLTAAEISRIRKYNRAVLTRSGVRYTPVFFLALLLLLILAALY
jgi:Flp pilus assembly protein protease CpaA